MAVMMIDGFAAALRGEETSDPPRPNLDT
jgi:hypothetical protein